MGLCKDCKYWGAYDNKACNKVDSLQTGAPINQKFGLKASAADDTNLQAWLITGPEFGCVQFTTKQ